jgi:hypothetical protein
MQADWNERLRMHHDQDEHAQRQRSVLIASYHGGSRGWRAS